MGAIAIGLIPIVVMFDGSLSFSIQGRLVSLRPFLGPSLWKEFLVHTFPNCPGPT